MENIVILGFGITGQSAYQALKGKYNIYIQDDNLDEISSKLDLDSEIGKIKTSKDISELRPCFVVKSPGLNPNNKYVQFCRQKGYDLVSDLELAYRLYPSRTIVAITGTNGKTTTTSLTGEIIEADSRPVHVIGNIGRGILEAFENGKEDDIYLIEVSSFQLEDTKKFRPTIGVFLNFSPDHLDWHGSVEAYFNSKAKLFANMTKADTLIVNKDNEALERIFSKADVFFSRLEKCDYYFEDQAIYGPKGLILTKDDIKIPGSHNLENILAAVSIASELGIDKNIIRKTVNNFHGVEHRLEFVKSIRGVDYYNDSKGTNVDSSIKAIESFNQDLIVIAGGYDKKVSFDEFFEASRNRVKNFILLGQTKDILARECEKFGFAYIRVDDMKEAVAQASKLARPGDVVVLSPASASWDMYPNFETRGRDFKTNVGMLGE